MQSDTPQARRVELRPDCPFQIRVTLSAMPSKSIEHFLTAKVAREYSLQHLRLSRVLPDIFAAPESLFDHYSREIRHIERLRTDLAACLTDRIADRKDVAERWALLLKGRAAALDSWAALGTALIAVFGVSSTLFALVASAAKVAPPVEMLVSFLAATALSLWFKVAVDQRAWWFKFIAGQLEGIAKLAAPSRPPPGTPPDAHR